MKKFIIISLITVMVAGTAFAADGIFFNAWGRGAFSPLTLQTAPKAYGDAVKDAAGDDVKGAVYGGAGASWGADKIRVDFRFNGAADFVGFQIHSNTESGNLGEGDNGYHIWAKPFESDILKLTVGRFLDDTLRGKIGNLDGGFSNFVLGCGIWEEDPIFARFATWDGTKNHPDHSYAHNGFMISSAPIEGLFIGLMVDGSMYANWAGAGSGTKAADMYRYMQIGAGYEIDGIGHIRAQFIGGFLGKYDDKKIEDKFWKKDFELPDEGKPARIEAAFALTAVENLLVDLGLKFWLPVEFSDDHVKFNNGIEAHLGAQFNMDALGIGARVDTSGLGSYAGGRATEGDNTKNVDPLTIGIRVVPTYALDAFTIGADIGFGITAGGKAANGDKIEASSVGLGFGAFVMKGLGNGLVKAGVSFTLPSIDKVKIGDETKSGANGHGYLQIPIILEYAFF